MTNASSTQKDLAFFLKAGSCLTAVAPSDPAQDLETLLKSRLEQYHDFLDGSAYAPRSDNQINLQHDTATSALSVVESVQKLLDVGPSDFDKPASSSKPDDIPAIGTRDLSLLRTLLSVVFKWGTEPLLKRVSRAWPSGPHPTSSSSKPVDMTETEHDFVLLSVLVTRLLSLLFRDGPTSKLPQTLITTTILNRHVSDILKPAIAVGWLPKSRNSEAMVTLDAVRPLVLRLIAMIQPSQAIVELSTVLSSEFTVRHVKKACSALLSRQLLRRDGVTGFFSAMFGEQDSTNGEIDLTKLEHAARIMGTPPATVPAEEYFRSIIRPLLDLTGGNQNSMIRRAAAFSVSHLLTHPVAAEILLLILHHALQTPTMARPANNAQPENPIPQYTMPAEKAVTTLITLILNSDPSPTLISKLLTPVVPALYSLLFHLEQLRTSDPGTVESLKGLLKTWGRVIEHEEGVSVLWLLIHDEQPGWKLDLEGQITRLSRPDRPSVLSMVTPQDREAVETLDENSNILNLYPDPAHFVQYLKSIERSDITSELFVKLLNSYRISKSRDEDPLQSLLYLQLVMQIQTKLTDGGSTSNILAKPAHILSFIKFTFESAIDAPPSKTVPKSSNLRIDTLRIVEDGHMDELGSRADSDDDSPDSLPANPDDEITETALNLLLSILEVHETLSARTEPLLNEIFELLGPLALTDASQSIRASAREARMVMTARLASTSSSKIPRRNSEQEDAQATYQKALKLLQDPILPVRAHGLLLLRQLVATPKSSSGPRLEPALVPAILSIFLQSIQDDDSYIFLNAVQGLSLMVDTYGTSVLEALIKAYSEGLGVLASSAFTQQEVDTRIRIGEALTQVIRRCGAALGIYVHILVPPLFSMFRASHLPTTLRTSALSLLGECENTYSLAMLPYTVDLVGAMIDLLQVERAPIVTPAPSKCSSESNEDTQRRATMIEEPTATTSKSPSLRRAAIHFLSVLLRVTIQDVYDNGAGDKATIPPDLMRRAKTTLAYIAATDEDTLVGVMAREAGELVIQLQTACH